LKGCSPATLVWYAEDHCPGAVVGKAVGVTEPLDAILLNF